MTSAEKSIGGVITGYENSRPMDNVSISASINGNLFRRKLTISVAPSFSYQRACTYRVLELSRFNFRGNIAYRLGNCRFSVEYESPRKDIFYTGISVTSDKDNWNFDFPTAMAIFMSRWPLWIFFINIHVIQSSRISPVIA